MRQVPAGAASSVYPIILKRKFTVTRISISDLPIIVKEVMAPLFVLQKVARLVLNARVDYFVYNVPLVACWKKDGSRNAHVNASSET